MYYSNKLHFGFVGEERKITKNIIQSIYRRVIDVNRFPGEEVGKEKSEPDGRRNCIVT